MLQALPIAGGVLGGISEALLVLLVGIYLAADPQAYMRSVVRLFPPHRRIRVSQILNAIAAALQKWLVGMAFDMLFVGVLTGLLMWLVGVPLPFALGVLTGVSVFVPYIGRLSPVFRAAARAQRKPEFGSLCRHRLCSGAGDRGQHHPAPASALGALGSVAVPGH